MRFNHLQVSRTYILICFTIWLSWSLKAGPDRHNQSTHRADMSADHCSNKCAGSRMVIEMHNGPAPSLKQLSRKHRQGSSIAPFVLSTLHRVRLMGGWRWSYLSALELIWTRLPIHRDRSSKSISHFVRMHRILSLQSKLQNRLMNTDSFKKLNIWKWGRHEKECVVWMVLFKWALCWEAKIFSFKSKLCHLNVSCRSVLILGFYVNFEVLAWGLQRGFSVFAKHWESAWVCMLSHCIIFFSFFLWRTAEMGAHLGL